MSNDKCCYRLPPCPSYDVAGMEAWLSDQAEKGLLLAKDGFFAGVATFERHEPCHAKYRLAAAQKSAGIWADYGGEPDPEQIELSRKHAWEYVGKRGDFYIYRNFDMDATELNTDPDVQALALNAVKKQRRSSVISLIFWAVAYPLIFLRGGLLLTILIMGTWPFLLTAAFVLRMIADEARGLISLQRFQNKLREDGFPQRGKDWRKGAAFYHGKRAVKWILAVALLCIFAGNWSDSVMNSNKTPLDEYTGKLPFASMLDFADSDVMSYKTTMTGLSMGFNTIQEWSDVLAPQCIEYNEHAQITLSDGRLLEGGYYADYFEARNPAIAKRLASEMYRIDSREKNFEPMQTFPLEAEADAIYVYWSSLHFPTAIIQNGSRVIRAYFFQTSSNYMIPAEEWISLVAASLG